MVGLTTAWHLPGEPAQMPLWQAEPVLEEMTQWGLFTAEYGKDNAKKDKEMWYISWLEFFQGYSD